MLHDKIISILRRHTVIDSYSDNTSHIDRFSRGMELDELFAAPNGTEGLRWLRQGTAKQQELAELLQNSGVLTALAPYDPSVAGTFPIGLDIPGSDLDILCEARDHDAFLRHCREEFGHLEAFQAYGSMTGEGEECSIVRFVRDGVPIELFGQNKPTADQNGCRHMIAERRLLALDEASAAESIRRLKLEGLKTEPAFALFYRLLSDPYNELYRLSEASVEEVRSIVADRH